MTWEDRKKSVLNAVENVLRIGQEQGTQDISFSCKMHLDYPDEFEYTIGKVIIPEKGEQK